MDIRITLAFLLPRTDFKSKTSFGFLSPNYTGQSTSFFVKLQNGLFTFLLAFLSSGFSGFQGVLGAVSAILDQIDILASRKYTTSVILVRRILLSKKIEKTMFRT